jgi:large subunit ribosomal protein L2
VGAIIMNGALQKSQKLGSALLVKNISIQRRINSLESKKNGGLKLLRASGSFGKILKKNFKFCLVRLKSGFIKKINPYSMAVIGTILNFNYYLFVYKTAGLSRSKGWRPRVRGVAMNPVDHPYGGGEGKKSKKSVCMSP